MRTHCDYTAQPRGQRPAARHHDHPGAREPLDDGAGAGTGFHGDVPAGAPAGDQRTEELVSHGRPTASPRRTPAGARALVAAVLVGALAAVAVMTLARGGPSWPSSVAVVQAEAAQACQNPNVASEPGQVNFACAKQTRQILWVFALLTSDDNPAYSDARTGRIGLEPIAPAQGGELAWSLNLHHPYNPASPDDSIAVAARAINNIIGGATVTGPHGDAVVQPGLEGDAANCARYTGSSAVTSRTGFPSLCARPVTSPAGEGALVADVYRKWMVGAPGPVAADAATLFENASDPGAPAVQAILRHLPSGR